MQESDEPKKTVLTNGSTLNSDSKTSIYETSSFSLILPYPLSLRKSHISPLSAEPEACIGCIYAGIMPL